MTSGSVGMALLGNFKNLKNMLNLKVSVRSFTMKGCVGKNVEFLDAETELRNYIVVIKMYFKPIDARRYVNRKINHRLTCFPLSLISNSEG